MTNQRGRRWLNWINYLRPLCPSPLSPVYQFIGEPWFEHDFDNVAFSADEFDARVGMPGLHSVRRKVEPIERNSILPREIFGRFVNESFWMDPKNNVSQVPIV